MNIDEGIVVELLLVCFQGVDSVVVGSVEELSAESLSIQEEVSVFPRALTGNWGEDACLVACCAVFHVDVLLGRTDLFLEIFSK